MATLLLDTDTWDLVLDINGNIAVATDPYAKAQDVASALKLFAGELWYDPSKGVPYFARILGEHPSASLIKGEFERAALTVPGIVKARVTSLGLSGRELHGIVKTTDQTGIENQVNF